MAFSVATTNRRIILLLSITLIFEWIWVFIGRPLPSRSSLPPSVHNKLPKIFQKRDIFNYPAAQILPIHEVCAKTQWANDVVFTCDNSVGGIGNVRNSILICTRLAISAGASLVLPNIVVRNRDDITQIRTGQTTTMDYMFDTQHYVQSLRLSCPGLKIYDNIEHVPNIHAMHGPLALQPEDLQEHTDQGLPHPESWAADFKAWLERETMGTNFNTANPTRTTIVALGRSYLIFPIYSDGKEFAHSFGNILQFRQDVRQLATEVIINLLRNHTLLDNYNGKDNIIADTYLAAHLRTEKDATEGWPADHWGWSAYAKQSEAYINQTLGDGLNLMYVASGDLEQLTRFTTDAALRNITVETKHRLLPDSSLSLLKQMSFDQQGLVDFLVMLKASDFSGVAHSSFAWSIALKRHTWSRRKDQLHLKGVNTLSDELSQIYGQVAGEYPATVWP